MVSNKKGWHRESMRHREARMFGKASGGKVSAPKSVRSISKKTKTKTHSDSKMWREIDRAGWKNKTKTKASNIEFDKWGLSDRQKDAEIINNMRTFDVDNDERVSKKLEHFEDKYGVDLTSFYGEDYTKQETRIKLKKKLGVN